MRLMLQKRRRGPALAMTVTALAVIMVLSTPSLLLAQAGSVLVFLDPPTIDLKQGEVVPVSVKVDASSQSIDTVQVFLDFDPSLLQVVDETGEPASTVSFGPVINDGEWRQPLLNQVDNDSGRIGVAAGKGPPASGAPDLEREFVLAVFNLKAVGEGAETRVTVDLEEQESRLRSKAIFKGTEVTGEGSGTSINIQAVAVPTSSDPVSAADSDSSLARTSATETDGASSDGSGPAAAGATPGPTVGPIASDGTESGADATLGEVPANSSGSGISPGLPAGIIGGAIVIVLAAFGVVLFLRGRRSSQRDGSSAIPLGPASR